MWEGEREGGSKLIGRRLQVGGDTWPPAGDGGGGRADWSRGGASHLKHPEATLEILIQKQEEVRGGIITLVKWFEENRRWPLVRWSEHSTSLRSRMRVYGVEVT